VTTNRCGATAIRENLSTMMQRSVFMRRSILGMLAVSLIGIGAAPALATPSYDEDDVFEITCGEELTLEVTMGPGLGIWTPAFVVDSDQRVLPYELSGTFEAPSGAIEVDEARKAPKDDRLYEGCSFDDGGFGGLVNGTVSFSLTPG
jgi:hypothetical protein